MATICVIGTGYVGLVTGTCFSDMGNRVTCVDIIPEKVERLKQGILPIYEPGLKEMVERNVRAGRLNFTTDYAEGPGQRRVYFYCREYAYQQPPGWRGHELCRASRAQYC